MIVRNVCQQNNENDPPHNSGSTSYITLGKKKNFETCVLIKNVNDYSKSYGFRSFSLGLE